ncbi:2-dehydro-3-deoxygluconokinase [Agromyces cerinus]|uniref:2-dehydro-3-deoxygluconokinase n=1 Tax=Agromyces hippuratus TaxID=286438 RepID=A0A852X3Q5_9MICO|nr:MULTISPECIES: sugar kinase [Agromyces]MBM7829861.1 2-dehydro-3-deoxygluconokinase [Agromyces cerinus]NYG20681.1 2-dehydro-3-deoxygluconokinase [Agromyces hippuratus]
MPDNPLPEVVALGETMALVAPALAEPLETADEFRVDSAGAEANVAAHLAALGRRAAWAGRLGDDALGRRVARHLRDRGVDTRWVETDDEAPTGVYFKDPGRGVRYYRAGSAASRMTPSFLDGLPLDSARVVHVSGITPALSASCDDLVDALVGRIADSPALLSFDVNHRSALWQAGVAAGRLRELASRADLVFVGLDEAEALWGTETPEAVRALLPEPALLIVKDGAIAATEFRDGADSAPTRVPARSVEVVEAVGAGDAFAAGYLASLLNGGDASERLAAGHARAVTVLGDTADFPRAETTTRSTR